MLTIVMLHNALGGVKKTIISEIVTGHPLITYEAMKMSYEKQDSKINALITNLTLRKSTRESSNHPPQYQ